MMPIRRCPGALLVDSTVWLIMASMLATLNIAKPVDKDGKVIEPVVEYHDAVFRCEGLCVLCRHSLTSHSAQETDRVQVLHQAPIREGSRIDETARLTMCLRIGTSHRAVRSAVKNRH